MPTIDGCETTEQEAWLESLGVGFVPVMFIVRGRVKYEKHVNDDSTLTTTVSDAMSRLGATSAVLPDINGGWLWVRRSEANQHFDTKEAAEMTAIHRG